MTRWLGRSGLDADNVKSVIKKMDDGGIEITALHNHLLRAEPMTLYMHVFGHGDPVKLRRRPSESMWREKCAE